MFCAQDTMNCIIIPVGKLYVNNKQRYIHVRCGTVPSLYVTQSLHFQSLKCPLFVVPQKRYRSYNQCHTDIFPPPLPLKISTRCIICAVTDPVIN